MTRATTTLPELAPAATMPLLGWTATRPKTLPAEAPQQQWRPAVEGGIGRTVGGETVEEKLPTGTPGNDDAVVGGPQSKTVVLASVAPATAATNRPALPKVESGRPVGIVAGEQKHARPCRRRGFSRLVE